jgi:hypothetical protein
LWRPDVASELDPSFTAIFDLYDWLGSTSAVARAKRLGIRKLYDMVDLPTALRRLHEGGEVSYAEAAELLQGLVDDGLIRKAHCSYFLI